MRLFQFIAVSNIWITTPPFILPRDSADEYYVHKNPGSLMCTKEAKSIRSLKGSNLYAFEFLEATI